MYFPSITLKGLLTLQFLETLMYMFVCIPPVCRCPWKHKKTFDPLDLYSQHSRHPDRKTTMSEDSLDYLKSSQASQSCRARLCLNNQSNMSLCLALLGLNPRPSKVSKDKINALPLKNQQCFTCFILLYILVEPGSFFQFCRKIDVPATIYLTV